MASFIPHLSISVLAIGSSVFCSDAYIPPASRLLPRTRAVPMVPPRPIHHTMTRRPIEEILLELDARGISFPPTATRSELERLLSQANVKTPNDTTHSQLHETLQDYDCYYDDDDDVRSSRKQQQQQVEEPMIGNRRRRQRQRQAPRIDFYERDDNSMNGRESRRRRRQVQQHQNGPLAPADVLFRVVDKTSKTVAHAIPEQVLDMGSKATRIASRTTQQLFHDLVDRGPPKKRKGVRRRKQLDDTAEERKTKVEQNSSPDRQDWQWEEHRLKDPVARDASSVVTEKLPSGDESSTTDSARIRVPIQDILSELKRRNIRFSPISTRAELEELLEQVTLSEEQPVPSPSFPSRDTATQDLGQPSSTTGTSTSASMDELHQDNVWKKASRVTIKKIKTVPQKLSETIGSKAKNTYQKARNSAASLFEDPSHVIDNDNNTPIIVDAIVEDITMQELPDDDDDVIDVEPFYRGERYRPPRRKAVPSKPGSDQKNFQETAKPRRHRRMYQEAETGNKRGSTIDRQPKDVPSPNARLPRLNPVKKMGSEELQSKRERGRRSTGDRTIYSPYHNSNDIYVDGLDRLGDFVANSVDSFLWGSEKEKEKETVPAMESPKQSSKRRKSGNWKDKMEEQFDYLLGIHEDGEYYNRWANDQLDNNQSTDDGTQGVPKTGRRKSRSGKERQSFEKPIWEEEGSLLSMLFGTGRPAGLRNDMFYWSPSSNGSGSVVKILKTLLWSATLVVSGVCRWASVRGSLPQPLVVVGVLSSVLSSRPGSRVRNVILMVLALRTVGELVHGYINDDTEFWDPIDDQDPMTGDRLPELD